MRRRPGDENGSEAGAKTPLRPHALWLSSFARAELEKFVALVELSSDFIAMAKLDGTVEYLNAAGRRITGLPPDYDVRQLKIADFLTPEGLRQSVEVEQPSVRETGSWQGESTLRDMSTGQGIPVTINSYLVVHPDTGEPLALATVQRDVRPFKQIERDLRTANVKLKGLARAHQLLSALGEMALTLTPAEFYQKAVKDIAEAFSGLRIALYLRDEDGVERLAAASQRDAPGDVSSFLARPHSVVVLLPEHPRVAGHLAAEWDIELDEDAQHCLEVVASLVASTTNRHAAESDTRFAALHDPLTGLPNRTLMFERLAHALEATRRSGRYVAVLLIDIDNFKTVNDSLGHAVGDELLVALAPRLRDAVRPGDTVARLGGDEFVVVCEDLEAADDAQVLAERLKVAWQAAFEIAMQTLFVSVTMGIAVGCAAWKTTPEQLLREADTAMYRAKRSDIGGAQVYDSKMRASVSRRLQLSNELRGALAALAIFPVFQPIVSTTSGDCVAVESLARWSLGRSSVSPREFIPIAEEFGLIRELGLQMLRASCEAVLGWTRRNASLGCVDLRVNVSARQLTDPRFVESVRAIIDEVGFPAHRLGFEVTEGVLVGDPDLAVKHFAQLQRIGVAILLDDFGTGFSSLQYLQRYPTIRFLKIDQSFVKALGNGQSDAAIVSAIVSLGHALGMGVIAEGVETAELAAHVRDLGCDFAQGYHFGRPLSAEDTESFLCGSIA